MQGLVTNKFEHQQAILVICKLYFNNEAYKHETNMEKHCCVKSIDSKVKKIPSSSKLLFRGTGNIKAS